MNLLKDVAFIKFFIFYFELFPLVTCVILYRVISMDGITVFDDPQYLYIIIYIMSDCRFVLVKHK